MDLEEVDERAQRERISDGVGGAVSFAWLLLTGVATLVAVFGYVTLIRHLRGIGHVIPNGLAMAGAALLLAVCVGPYLLFGVWRRRRTGQEMAVVERITGRPVATSGWLTALLSLGAVGFVLVRPDIVLTMGVAWYLWGLIAAVTASNSLRRWRVSAPEDRDKAAWSIALSMPVLILMLLPAVFQRAIFAIAPPLIAPLAPFFLMVGLGLAGGMVLSRRTLAVHKAGSKGDYAEVERLLEPPMGAVTGWVIAVQARLRLDQIDVAERYALTALAEPRAVRESSVLLVLLGEIRFEQGRFDEARACFEAAIEVRPTYTSGYFLLATLQLEQGEAGEQTLELLERAADHLARMNMATGLEGVYDAAICWVHAEMADETAARAAEKRALDRLPDDQPPLAAWVHYRLGRAMLALDDVDAAGAYFELASSDGGRIGRRARSWCDTVSKTANDGS